MTLIKNTSEWDDAPKCLPINTQPDGDSNPKPQARSERQGLLSQEASVNPMHELFISQ